MVRLSKLKTKVNLNRLRFNNNKKLGEGFFGAVYKLHNNKRTNKKYVAKKVKTDLPLKFISFLGTGMTQREQFVREVTALEKLSKLGISPKIYHFNEENMTYVIERLDYNLTEMINKNIITPKHIYKLINVLKKIQKTKIKHNDLHSGNIMYSKSKNRFYIIDLGLFEVLNECENGKVKKICYNFEKINAEMLFDLLIYIRNKIKSSKTSNLLKSKYNKVLRLLLKLFNIDNEEFINSFSK